jgi:hypothetical protein
VDGIEADSFKREQVKHCFVTSVPNPDPPDPHVFEPPGSGSASQRSEVWILIQIRILLLSSKNIKKNLDSYCLTSFGLFIFEK